VKKIIPFLILIVLLVDQPSHGYEKSDINIEDLPSKEDITGFVHSFGMAIKNNFFSSGNIYEDLIVINGEDSNNWLSKAMKDYYNFTGMEYNGTEVEQFVNSLSLTEEQRAAIALLIYSYIQTANENNMNSMFRIINAIRETAPIIEKINSSTVRGPYGLFVIGGKENDVYTSPGFIIETGGDDIYRNMNNSFIFDSMGNDKYRNIDSINGSCVIYDEEGNDNYLNTCTASNGFALTMDLNGNDRYNGSICSSYNNSLALLFDASGCDIYKGNERTQCYSESSFSILIDVSGDDIYDAKNFSQASSFDGVSALIDLSGNDMFLARNASQAFATGSNNKGVAILLNMEGDDYYQAGDNSQGYAGKMGFAAIIDFIGNDIYKAGSYSQASAPFMGVSALIDVDGMNKFRHGAFSGGFMMGGISFFMNNYEFRGDSRVINMLNKLDFDISDFFG